MKSKMFTAVAGTAALSALFTTAPSQVTVTATAGTFVVQADAIAGAVPPGTDVTFGTGISLTGTTLPTPPTASATFSVSLEPALSVASLRFVAMATGTPFGSGFASADAHVDVVYTSPIPIAVDLTLIIPRLSTNPSPCASTVGSVTAVNVGSATTGPHCSGVFPIPPCTITLPATIDANGLTVRLAGTASAVGQTLCGGVVSAGGTVTCEVRPRALGVAYGPTCGATMTASADLSTSREVVEIDGTQPLGVLLIGSQQVAIPLPWNCLLLTDAIGSAPLVMDPNGNVRFSFAQPTPGIFTLQAGVFGATVIEMTNGLQL